MTPDHASAGLQPHRNEDGVLQAPRTVRFGLAGDVSAQARQQMSLAASRFSIYESRSSARAGADGPHRQTASIESRLMNADNVRLQRFPGIAHNRLAER